MGPFADLTELYTYNVAPEDIGRSGYVTDEDSWYRAVLPGLGSICWEKSRDGTESVVDAAFGRVLVYQRTFAFDDIDIHLAAQAAVIDFGDPLPTGAIVLATIADITDWTDGGASTFGADVGISGGDDDAYTPTELNIDGGTSQQIQVVCIPASGVQLAVRFFGSVNLSTLTGGTLALKVLILVPDVTTLTEPAA